MPRIPEETLDQIKREISLQALVEAKGIILTPHGKNLVGLCPFHPDKDPSLVITPEKNLWHCLGACQTGGSVIDWVMKAEGVSFKHAVELLRTRTPSMAATMGKVIKQATIRKLPPPVEPSASDHELLGQVIRYYCETLKNSPEALAYLQKRGLMHPELINRFQLGYSNRTLGLRLPAKNRKPGAEIRERLQALGILRESGHEHFNGSIVIPVLNERGAITEVYGRKILDTLRPGTAYHLYLPGPHRGVWNLESLDVSKEIILCESLIDAMTFWCHGFRNVTASFGVEGFTRDIFEAFKRHGTEKILIAYDRDDAGEKAARNLGKKLAAEGFSCFRLLFPRGMDANEFALAKEKPADALDGVIRNAEWLAGVKPVMPFSLAATEKGGDENWEPADARAGETAPDDFMPDGITPDNATCNEPTPGDPTPTETKAGEMVFTMGDRRYRVRGLGRNMSLDQLRVNVLVSHGEAFHADTFDLYSARPRLNFINLAAKEIGATEEVIKKDLGRILLKLEEVQERQVEEATKPKRQTVALSNEERIEAMEFLKTPDLLNRILEDFKACGVIGEETNKLVGYLSAISRKLENPLAVIIQSSSSAGKTALMESILAFLPEEETVKYSAVTGQSLFYMSESDLKHKVLAIVEEEGAEKASYALKLLQSEGELTIASTGKDPSTGRLTTHEYKVEGPVMILLTTTAVEIDEELLNRCIVLTVNEDREQTRAIHDQQRRRETLEGLLAQHDRTRILRIHKNAQRMLRPILVANPYARELTFMDDRTRARRDHMKYLTLIRSIALLHQYQRPVKAVQHKGEKVRYIEVTLDDIAMANRLAHEVLGRSLDELAPQTRRLLLKLDWMVTKRCGELKIDRADYRFTRRGVREATGWTEFQVRVHLNKLLDFEYVLAHRGGRGQSFVYELLYDGTGIDGKPFLMNLLDVEALQNIGTAQTSSIKNPGSRGTDGGFETGSSPQRASNEPGSSIVEMAVQPFIDGPFEPEFEKTPEIAYKGQKNQKS